MIISWDESLSVGVNEFDEQHKKLIDLINQLHEAMTQGKAKDILSDIIAELIKYTAVHFGTEEKYFDQYNYPESATHRLEHQKFVKKVSDFQSQFNSGQVTLSIEIMNFLKDWLVSHIKGTDQKYTGFFKEKGLQ